ncbi:hypothetical protein QFC20_007574 [Naganishia adeliensis]|uniref:Uncharacterized protein n=1 Tax=Naganishia adeliensis TaxID=92952 RepID=A0ACC2UYD7_9TREE|nr:hypothetical protein QFC20_007574 [Naganishia adeliensis]
MELRHRTGTATRIPTSPLTEPTDPSTYDGPAHEDDAQDPSHGGAGDYGPHEIEDSTAPVDTTQEETGHPTISFS